MANNCSNWITVEGSKEELDKFFEYFQKARSEDGTYDFSRLFGEGFDLGARWFDPEIELYEGHVSISGDSAWKPPLALFQNLSEMFDVKMEHLYEESGCDFAGRAIIEGGIVDDECYGYWEGKFIIDHDNAFDEFLNNEIMFLAEEQELADFLSHEAFLYMNEDNKKESIEEFDRLKDNFKSIA